MIRLTDKLADARAWRGENLSAEWRFTLPAECSQALAESRDARAAQWANGAVVGAVSAIDPRCRGGLRPVARALEDGPGFAIIEGLDVVGYGREDLLAAYYVLGHCLGEPIVQNIEGDLLYDVRDTGQDVAEGARFSVTNAESTFHNDSAFSPRIPDYVGLLCLRSASVGGRSQLISACSLHDALLEETPDVLATLYDDFFFDRRGQFHAGEDPVHRAPIMAWDGRELTMRYLRYYIEVGHERAVVPLSAVQKQALAAVEELLQRQSLRLEFDLQPGQMLFVNNHWIMHNRTAFEDDADPERRRHYSRLGLGRRGDSKNGKI